MRATYHVAMLILLAGMTLSGVGARWQPELAPAVLAASATAVPTHTPESVVSALANQTTPSNIVAPAAVVPTAAAPAAAPSTIAAAPPKPAAQWVENFKATELYDGPGGGAASLGTAAQFRTFQIVEQHEDGRSKLFDPGVGVGKLPGEVWANLSDFGPSGPPKYEFELAKGGDVVDQASGRRAPERITNEWPPLPTGESAVVIDAESGAVLYAKNAHAHLPEASITKIMTAIVAIENGQLSDRFKVDVDSNALAASTESTIMGLMPGDEVSLETLLYGLMLPSGNDAAIAIAKHVGGSEQNFVQMMNDKALAMGLHDTQFKNPHGLDVSGHYSSAYDLAVMARYGMANPTFYSVVSARHWTGDGFDLWNLNKLLPVYAGADGVKPGFTDNAGRCLVGSAVRDNHRVIVVDLRSQDPTSESRALLDYAFNGFRWPS
jgi:hypothetical protein